MNMNTHEFDSENSRVQDDNLRLPLRNQNSSSDENNAADERNVWSYKYYERIIRKYLGINQTLVLTLNEELILRLLFCLAFFAIGVGYYASVEGWTFNQCCYFIAVSLSGIGYGHIVPTTGGSRTFTCFYIVCGMLLVTNTVSICVSRFVIPAQNKLMDHLSPSSSREEQHAKHKIGSIVLIMLVMLLGLLYFSVNEDWGINSSFYFVIITMTTVGYGDFFATTTSSMSFLIFFIILCSITYMGALENFGFFHNASDLTRSTDINPVSSSLVSCSSEHFENKTAVTPKSSSSNSAPKIAITSQSYGHEESCFILEHLLKQKVLNKERDIDPILTIYRNQQEL